jgi:phosphate transport system permease protein
MVPTLQVSRRHNRTAAQKSRLLADRLVGGSVHILTILPVALVGVFVAVLLVRAWPLLSSRPLGALFSDRAWLPTQGQFNFLPFILGTLWVTAIALIVAVPICLLTAVYLSEYARASTRAMIKPVLDVLAAVPSVVFGVWGVIVIVPWVGRLAESARRHFGSGSIFSSTNPTGYSILSGSLVLAMMIAPLIIAMAFEVLQAVPDGDRQAALALGATRWEMTKWVLFPKTATGIIAAVMLGAGRAMGETMAILMVVGNVARIPASVFDPAYPLPALIANNFGEMVSIPLFDAALMTAALILLIFVMIFNIFAGLMLKRIVKAYA